MVYEQDVILTADGVEVQGEVREAKDAKKWRGLGDAVSAATSAVGFKPCGGCGRRISELNEAVPFSKTGS
jgi:hypothetical protein